MKRSREVDMVLRVSRKRSSDESKKSTRTRERIRAAAFSLFGEVGYEQTTMRAIAARAECALGLIYRYFPRREDLVVALYESVETQVAEAWSTLPPGPLHERIATALQMKVRYAWPHRRAYAAISPVVLDRTSSAGLFSERAGSIRAQVRAALRALVEGSSDAPGSADIERIVQVLYLVQLVVMLAATQDPHDDASATLALVDTLATMTRQLGLFLGLAGPMFDQLAAHMAAFEASS
jgi:AcrR family transcriptional regulator